MKHRIRLTESDLHRIVKESVKNILTELDWTRYRDAMQKNYEMEPEYDEEFDNLKNQLKKAKMAGDRDLYRKISRKMERGSKGDRTLDFSYASDNAFNTKFLNKPNLPYKKTYIDHDGDVKDVFCHNYGTPNCEQEMWSDGDVYDDDRLRSMGYSDDDINSIKNARTELQNYRNR